ncbi:ABC transporter ATP-binding protein [Heliorestis convoluta]|uniref:ABC transporter family protein n=1 Tax=Heliorestis convoluta TaxID=356322 RepID=A0A5Q2N5W5_9FIRM|nr:ABC transporter ATP-binding protein [Heliorestis convoluta]QGG47640.1 ABC transporter family protein [Heliorestis convoluta]
MASVKYEISKRFTMESPITSRTLAISEAFGISLDDEQTFTVYDNEEITITTGDIVYITGDSGSGKSILLRELKQRIPNGISNSELTINSDQPIIEAVGKDLEEAMYLLSLVGLNDAFIFLRKYSELSDGQKYRFQLAKLLESNANCYFIDEYCALLDRETAKVVSFNIQKICRKLGKTLIVATAHTDLADDLLPNLLIRKGLENDVQVEYRKVRENPQCSLVEKLELLPATLEDYYVLSRFHYRQRKVQAVQEIYKLVNGKEIVGVIVYVYPPLALAGRNVVTSRYKAATSEVARLINQEVTMISRVVLHPKYRGIGLGTKLIKDTMPLTSKRYVEALTVMGRYNPFNEKAGLRKVEYETKDRYKKVRNQLILLGWDMKMASTRQYNLDKLNDLDEATYKLLADQIVTKVLQGRTYCVRGGGRKGKVKDGSDFMKEEVASMIKEIVPKEKVYLIWENPDWNMEAVG